MYNLPVMGYNGGLYMDLFERLEEKQKKIAAENRSVNINPAKHHKRYGTKRPEKKIDKHDIIASWREDM